MIKSLLIANRGEIACRIIRTARRMGIRTIAVYSDADAKALHVRSADEAVHIGPSPANESYLVGEKIIAAARETGAEAIHPGYGFLSENADFAQSVIDAGLIWVGPKPDSIRAMGLKDAAKKLMEAAGVPTTPGYIGDDQDPDYLAEQAAKIGYPVLIKAVAGGGGKGMRKVESAAGFADGLLSAQREAKAAFGNDIVLIEKWIESPRHIEVQVFGDSHGNVVHLFERDCSLQRRHQKVIEEAPAPGMDAATREAVCGAAVRAAQAVNYEGAGTIEFIADGSEGLRADRIWFMEMNTRLQVEHPVTEMITGVDLVEWQLRVASGEKLPKTQGELRITGHAVEARVYAEVPWREFLPASGPVDWLYNAPPTAPDAGYRIELGVAEGGEVSTFYDPMIAKLVAHDVDRESAIYACFDLARGMQIWPVQTNLPFLVNLLYRSDWAREPVDTGYIGRNLDTLSIMPEPDDMDRRVAAKWLYAHAIGSDVSADDRQDREGTPGPGFLRAYVAPTPISSDGLNGFRINSAHDTSVTVHHAGHSWRTSVQSEFGDAHAVAELIDGQLVVFHWGSAFAFSDRYDASGAGATADGDIVAPMPGKVIAVEVGEGDAVAAGQKLLTLEAMKMEHSLVAPFDGTVAKLNATAGGQVSEGTLLVRIEAPGE